MNEVLTPSVLVILAAMFGALVVGRRGHVFHGLVTVAASRGTCQRNTGQHPVDADHPDPSGMASRRPLGGGRTTNPAS